MAEELGICDTCYKPMVEGDAFYTIASPGPRHYECQQAKEAAFKQSIKDLDVTIKKAQSAVNALRNLKL